MSGKTTTQQQPTFQTQTTTIPPEVLARYNAVNDKAAAVASTPFQTYSTDPNAFVAPLNSTQTGAIDNITGMAGGTQPAFNAAYGLTGAGADPTYNTVGNYMNPFLGMVAAPALQYLQQQQGQDLAKQQSQQIQSGAFGGDRAGISRAVLQGQQGLAQESALGNILNTGYNTALGAAQQGANQALAAGTQFGNLGVAQQGANLAQAGAQLGAGTTAQQTSQAGLQALYNQFLQSVAYPFQTTQFQANIAEGTGAQSGNTTTGIGQTNTTSPAPFFSDKRLKKHIKKVGKLYDGQSVYSYDMGDGRTQIGLMAQEAEKHHPEAVGLAGGFKTLDYGKATKKAARRGKFYAGGLVPNDNEQRQAFAYGGSDIQSIVASQAQALGLAGAGGGGLAQTMYGAPRGGGSYVPAPMPSAGRPLQGAQLNLHPSPAQTQKSGLQQAMGEVNQLGDLWKTGQSVASGLGAAKDKVASWAKDKPANDVGAAAPADGSLVVNDAPLPPVRPEDFARGGLAEGGMPYDTKQDGYFPDQVLTEGEKQNATNLMKPASLDLGPHGGGQSQQGGGLMSGLKDIAGAASAASTIGSGLSSIAEFLPALFLATGGVASNRKAFLKGGSASEDVAPSDAPDPVDYMARTILREAGGEGDEGMAAVGHVIKNRLGSGRWGDDIPSVVTAPSQFTPWNPENAGTKADPRLVDPASPGYQKARAIASGVMSGDIADPTGGALNFYNPDLADPKWGPGMGGQKKIGSHLFGTAGGEGGVAPSRAMAYAPGEGSPTPAPGLGARAAAPPAEGGKDEGTGIGDWFGKNQTWLVPLLSGIGTMASSPSRYLGAAVLQGIGGGAKSYAQMQKQAADIAQTQAHTSQTGATTENINALTRGINQGVVQKSFFSGPNGLPMVMLADGKTIINLTDWAEHPREVFGGAANAAVAKDLLRRYQAGEKLQLPPAPTAGPAAPPSPAPDGGGQQPFFKPTPTKLPVGVSMNGDPSTVRAEEFKAAYGLNPEISKQKSKQYVDSVDADASVAGKAKLIHNEIAGILSEASQSGGLDRPGIGSDTTSKIIGALNRLSSMVGLKDKDGNAIQFGSSDSKTDVLNKLRHAQGAVTGSSGGQTAYGSVLNAISTMPDQNQNPQAALPNAALNMVQTQRAIDKQIHAQEYGKNTQQLYSGAERNFNSSNPDNKYAAEQGALAKLMADPGDPKTGRVPGHVAFNMMRTGTTPDGKPVSQSQMEQYLQHQYGVRGLSRYFGAPYYGK